jgi:hypothetical protein
MGTTPAGTCSEKPSHVRNRTALPGVYGFRKMDKPTNFQANKAHLNDVFNFSTSRFKNYSIKNVPTFLKNVTTFFLQHSSNFSSTFYKNVPTFFRPTFSEGFFQPFSEMIQCF